MGTTTSVAKVESFHPFDSEKFAIAWLAFKGVSQEGTNYVAKKTDLLSSKVFRNIFGELMIQYLSENLNDRVTQEAFILTMSRCFEGNTEDRISYIFSMYGLIYNPTERNAEGYILSNDYLRLLKAAQVWTSIPKKLNVAIQECNIDDDQRIKNSQFVEWVRKYPDLMNFLAANVPPSKVVDAHNPPEKLSLQSNDSVQRDPLNHSPSCRSLKDNSLRTFNSFDFIDGEDSGDEDSDELYDSDEIQSLDLDFEAYEISYDERMDEKGYQNYTKQVGENPRLSSKGNTNGVGKDDRSINDSSKHKSEDANKFSGHLAAVMNGKPPKLKNRVKMGKNLNIGKVVNGGMSKVGSVGRSILHSQPSASSTQNSPQAIKIKSESVRSKSFMCGYLYKIGDGKWTKKSWHWRWFVLDRQKGILSYYRHNPAHHLNTASRGTVIMHQEEEDDHHLNEVVDDNSIITSESHVNQVGMNDETFVYDQYAIASEKEEMNEINSINKGKAIDSGPDSNFDNRVAATTKPSSNSNATTDRQTMLLYMNSRHPWYRGELDLNKENISLLFEKNLAKDAPTTYYFQVSTVSLENMDSKRGIQYKLCASNEIDFENWTQAISEAINKKHDEKVLQNAAPVLTHQQRYRQKLQEMATQSKNIDTDNYVSWDNVEKIPTQITKTFSNQTDEESGSNVTNAVGLHYEISQKTTSHRKGETDTHLNVNSPKLRTSHTEVKKEPSLAERRQLAIEENTDSSVDGMSTMHQKKLSTSEVLDSPSRKTLPDQVLSYYLSTAVSPTSQSINQSTKFEARNVQQQEQHQRWMIHLSIEGGRMCFITVCAINVLGMNYFYSQHLLVKFVICTLLTISFVYIAYHPYSNGPNKSFGSIAKQHPLNTSHFNMRRKGSGDCSNISTQSSTSLITSNILPASIDDLSQCSNPLECCLHRIKTYKELSELSESLSRRSSYNIDNTGSVNELYQCEIRRNSIKFPDIKKFAMGMSMNQLTRHEECNTNIQKSHGYSITNGELFSVRSVEYKRSKRKEPSKAALFEFLAADLVRTDNGKIDLISQRVELPESIKDEDIFVINAQLPNYGPSVWGGGGDGRTDGPGYSLILYWKIPQPAHSENPDANLPALKLFRKWVEYAEHDKSLFDRFKVIAQVANLDDCGITGMAKKLLVSHNATPVLTRPQHRIYHFNGGSTEIVVDVHEFSYIARRGIYMLLDKTSNLVIDLGFVLQGEVEEELPEQILGCCRLEHVDLNLAMSLPE